MAQRHPKAGGRGVSSEKASRGLSKVSTILVTMMSLQSDISGRVPLRVKRGEQCWQRSLH